MENQVGRRQVIISVLQKDERASKDNEIRMSHTSWWVIQIKLFPKIHDIWIKKIFFSRKQSVVYVRSKARQEVDSKIQGFSYLKALNVEMNLKT